MQYEGSFPSPSLEALSNMRQYPQAAGLPSFVPSMPGITPYYNASYKGTEVGYYDVKTQKNVKPDYDLMYTDEFELGVRLKGNKNISFDGEVFCAIYKDLDVFSRVVLYTDPLVTGNAATDAATLGWYYFGDPRNNFV